MAKIYAPWNGGQVIALERWQYHGSFHPYTCPNHDCIGDPTMHRVIKYGLAAGAPGPPNELAALWRSSPVLVPTEEGFICPRCGTRQTWAHDFSLISTKRR